MNIVVKAFKFMVVAAFVVFVALLFAGPSAWIEMGLLVECKYVESCAKEHNIEYVERKK